MNKFLLTIVFFIMAICCHAQGQIQRPQKQSTPTQKTQTKKDKFEPQTTPNIDSVKKAEPTKPTSGTLNGHEWVDLGLPSGTKWATCNIGANSPYTIGSYFTILRNFNNEVRDRSTEQWGDGWTTPKKGQFEELIKYCRWVWREVNKGFQVIGPNGNSIFFIAGGHKESYNIYNKGDMLSYWSKDGRAYLSSSNFKPIIYYNSYAERLIRPVCH